MLSILLGTTAGNALAQDTTQVEQTQVRQVRPGFDLPDSLYRPADTLGFEGGIDTIVQYTAKDSIVFDVTGRRMILVNDAEMLFQGRSLNAYTIVVNFNNSTLTAYSDDFDSIIENSLSRRRRVIRDTDRVENRGAPILREGDTPYEGEIIVYNFRTRQGTVQLGTSTMEGGFYYGERIKQVDRQTLFVENGRFTTCDAPIPHFYFESPRMKVELRDKVFAAPVYMYVADVPIFALPFGLFPNQGGGRRSGIIAPNYQTTGSRGWGLTSLGYYQVFSDYFDAAVRGDIFTIGGYKVNLLTQYMQRYWLNSPASMELGYGFTRSGESDPYTKEWLLGLRVPNLILGLFTSLSANLNFLSSKFYQNGAKNIEEALTQNANSQASFSTQWEDIGVTLGIDYSRSQNLNDNTFSERSPALRISKSTFFPFAPSADEGVVDKNVLQTLSLAYDFSAIRSLDRQLPHPDSAYKVREQYGILHTPRISISPKLGHFSFTPSFSYSEAWFFRHLQRTPVLIGDTAVAFDDQMIDGFRRVHTYSLGVGLGTTLYGIANIGALGITAVRHTVRPSVGVNYQPDFSDQEIDTYINPLTGLVTEYNIFQNDHNSGRSGRGESMTMSFGLGNDFEAKIQREITADSVADERIKLLSLNANSGYDVIQDRFSTLQVSASSDIGASLALSGNGSFSFYPADQFGNDSTERTLISLNQGFLRPLNATFSLRGSFSSSTSTEGDNIDSLRRLFNIETPEDERALHMGGQFPGRFVYVPFRPTWNISYNFSYTETYSLLETVRNFSGNLNLTLALTRNWNISTGASYDFVNKEVVVPNVRITRDLHCWEMNFDYRPMGSFRGFNFEIRIKAEQLRDIKLTRAEGPGSSFY